QSAPNTTETPPSTSSTASAGPTSRPGPNAPTAPHGRTPHETDHQPTSPHPRPRHPRRRPLHHQLRPLRVPPRRTRPAPHQPRRPQPRRRTPRRPNLGPPMSRPPRAVTKPGLYRAMDDRTYHADPVPGGSLSSTGARQLLDSPARYQWEQQNRQGRRAFDVGHVVHTKILGTGAPIVTYPDEHLTPSGNPSTKAATKAWEDEQRANGLAIISRADLALVEAMAEAVLAHPGARELLEKPGHSEVSAFAPDPDTGVWCRARFDRLTDDGLAIDLKTTAGSASPAGFGRDAARFGYPIQEAHYLHTHAWAIGTELPAMRWIVVEKRAPHLVAVHEMPEDARLLGSERAATARHIYAECKATNTWPGYPTETLTAAVPNWWFYGDDGENQERELKL